MRNKLLILTVTLAAILRILFLQSYPVGFTPDEASFAYDAYSILKTGKDQWGHTMPINLESFGDFKASLLTYLMIPSVAVLGLTQTAARIPGAILGTLSVFVTYLLVKKLFDDKTALIASLLLAISPWHIMLSRGAFEANLVSFFMPLSIYLFLIGLKNPKIMMISMFAFLLNTQTYHTARFITIPIIVALYFLYLYKEKNSRSVKTVVIAATSFILVLNVGLLLNGASQRVKDVSITNGALERSSVEKISSNNAGLNPIFGRIIYNKYRNVVKQASENYLQYFSPQFLVTNGPRESTYGMMPGRGVLHYMEAVFLLIFILTLSRKAVKKEYLFILFWIFVSPIPASLTSGVGFAANRAAAMLPAIQIASALGVVSFAANRKKALAPIVVLFFISLTSFLVDYIYLSPAQASKQMLSQNIAAIEYIKNNFSKNDKILVSTSLSEPHIYTAFVYKWDPAEYQKETQNWNYMEMNLKFVDQLSEYRLGNFEYKKIDWIAEKYNTNKKILVGKADEFPEDVTPIATFHYPSGEKSILIVRP